MTQNVLHLKDFIAQLRHMLPENTTMAQAIDQHEPWEQVAIKAIDDGYIESAEESVRFVEACVRCST